jgi:AcrR family transcriptional regulator
MSRTVEVTQKTRMSRGRKRRMAGREEILSVARAIGVRGGWGAVTIRSVAQKLGYTSPLLYEHFRDKEDLLTRIAVEAIAMLEKELTAELPEDPAAACTKMAERYWAFVLEHRQLYRLMNGMDGALIDKEAVARSAESICGVVTRAVRPLMRDNAGKSEARMLADELWALLHGMAALYLDRAAPFDVARVTDAAMRLIRGTATQ